MASKNGLIGKYSASQGEKYFAVIVLENADEKKREECIFAINAQIANLRQAEIKPLDSQTLSQVARDAQLKITRQPEARKPIYNLSQTARNIFDPPEQVIFEPDTEIRDVIQDRLNSEKDTIFICPDKPTYVQTCAEIGITRADHLVSAELHALMAPSKAKEHYVAGRAHELRNSLLQIKRERIEEDHKLRKKIHKKFGLQPEKIMGNNPKIQKQKQKDDILNELSDRFIDDIPSATKFRLGLVANNSGFMSCPINKPWLFRLPFKKCLFEVEGQQHPSQGTGKISTFLLAQQLEEDENLFRADFLTPHPNDPLDIRSSTFFIIWDISGEELKVGRHFYDEQDIYDFLDEENSKFIISALFPFISRLNSTKTKIEVVHPPTGGRAHKRNSGSSPYYDYHVLVPEPKTEASEPAPGEEFIARRLHKRRGHYRTYSAERYTNMRGKTVWIEEKIWGDENLGILGKEYDLSKMSTESNPDPASQIH